MFESDPLVRCRDCLHWEANAKGPDARDVRSRCIFDLLHGELKFVDPQRLRECSKFERYAGFRPVI